MSRQALCIGESTRLIYDIMHYTEKVQIPGLIVLIDFQKAFDLISWIYLFGILRRFQHCTGHIMMGSLKDRGNQYIKFVRVRYCKLLTNGKQLPAFPLEAVPGT